MSLKRGTLQLKPFEIFTQLKEESAWMKKKMQKMVCKIQKMRLQSCRWCPNKATNWVWYQAPFGRTWKEDRAASVEELTNKLCSQSSSTIWKDLQTRKMCVSWFVWIQLQIPNRHLIFSSFSWPYLTHFGKTNGRWWKLGLFQMLNVLDIDLVTRTRPNHDRNWNSMQRRFFSLFGRIAKESVTFSC